VWLLPKVHAYKLYFELAASISNTGGNVISLKLQSVAFTKIVMAHLDSNNLTANPNMHYIGSVWIGLIWAYEK
jgi:hypothetical protein